MLCASGRLGSRWNFDQGESELRYAIQLDPTQADYHDWLAVLLVERGNFEEGMNQIALAPVDENSRVVLAGNIHPLARTQFDQGEAPASTATGGISAHWPRRPAPDPFRGSNVP